MANGPCGATCHVHKACAFWPSFTVVSVKRNPWGHPQGLFVDLCKPSPKHWIMKTLCLKHHGTSVTVYYSDEDSALIDSYSWYVHRGGYISGTLRGTGARNRPSQYMHRLILPPPEGLQIDHINGNRSDNRRCNLRCVPPSMNSLNQNNRLRKNNTHGFRGVALHKPSGLWQARLSINKRRYNLGYFKTAKEASTAYKKAAKSWLPNQCLEVRTPRIDS